MGGGNLGPSNFSSGQAANMQTRMEGLTIQGNQDILNIGIRNVDTRPVLSTAALRVRKADWEIEYDRKDREVNEMIERQRHERERVRIEEDIAPLEVKGED